MTSFMLEVGTFEVSHVNIGSRVEAIDDHLAINRTVMRCADYKSDNVLKLMT